MLLELIVVELSTQGTGEVAGGAVVVDVVDVVVVVVDVVVVMRLHLQPVSSQIESLPQLLTRVSRLRQKTQSQVDSKRGY